jgi:hypothetical protein
MSRPGYFGSALRISRAEEFLVGRGGRRGYQANLPLLHGDSFGGQLRPRFQPISWSEDRREMRGAASSARRAESYDTP